MSSRRMDKLFWLTHAVQAALERAAVRQRVLDSDTQLRTTVESLEHTKRELQEKVVELEQFVHNVVGRELKMIEVEKENARLKRDVQELTEELARLRQRS